ncbi:Hypothetical protein, putative [Bodo saltans]|uniref:Uncharacterized protein n=1 Tax=Bodo saltans TaxID=75058 RepID=A0A0S4IJ04_BODSA|nr:Hypothetical protein, putative [Bodo saltans]|eukprot:CUE73890.1 Hypothetical protein, putative [Bodo saltans]
MLCHSRQTWCGATSATNTDADRSSRWCLFIMDVTSSKTATSGNTTTVSPARTPTFQSSRFFLTATAVAPSRHLWRPHTATSCCPRSVHSLVVFVLALLFCCTEQPTTFIASGAKIGCGPCCPYDCDCYTCYSGGWDDYYYTCCYSTCYSCECFTATATGGDWWSGCVNKVLYVNPGASGEIVNNYQVSLQYNGNGASGQVDGNASVGNVYVYGSSTTTYTYGSIGTFNGNGYGSTSVYVYSPATIGTLNGVASGTISVASGAPSQAARCTSAAPSRTFTRPIPTCTCRAAARRTWSPATAP